MEYARHSLTDSLGRTLEVPLEPKRIVSLCPSQTETLFALGLESHLVGRTRYCIHPAPAVEKVPIVGGTKKVETALIAALEPDLIIAQKEENTPAIVEELSTIAPVYVTQVESYEEALESIRRLGEVTARLPQAQELVQKIEAAFAVLRPASPPIPVLYLIWRKPYMAAGKGTFIHSLLTRLGWDNVAASLPGRYPTLDEPERLAPACVLLSTEPYPFSEKHFPEVQRYWPQAHPVVVRGDYFSWYGVRMQEAAPYLQRLQHELQRLLLS